MKSADNTPAIEKKWTEMNGQQQKALEKLGWTQSSWDGDDGQEADDFPLLFAWESLSAEQQAAAKSVGYTKENFKFHPEGVREELSGLDVEHLKERSRIAGIYSDAFKHLFGKMGDAPAESWVQLIVAAAMGWPAKHSGDWTVDEEEEFDRLTEDEMEALADLREADLDQSEQRRAQEKAERGAGAAQEEKEVAADLALRQGQAKAEADAAEADAAEAAKALAQEEEDVAA